MIAHASTLAAAAIIAAGAALQGAVGIGFAVLAAPLLLIIEPQLVPGPLLFLGMLLAGMSATREFRSVDVRELSLAMVGRVAGTASAGVAIALLPLPVFSTLFAVMILTAVAVSLTRWVVLPTPRNLVAAGLLSGFMGTITSVGSPPMGLVYQNMPGPKVRATIGAFFLLGASFSLVTLAVVGRFTVAQMQASAWLVPPLALGFFASRRFIGYVDRSRAAIKRAVLTVSAGAACTLLAKQFF